MPKIDSPCLSRRSSRTNPFCRRRIELLSADLKELERRREQHRARRKKDNVLVGAIVGYTNVGKSTLMNALTQAGVLAEDKLFATLDITSRALELPDGRTLMLVDTVGLVRRLPHNLVEAFKSTLEEAANADIIINLIDISASDGYEQSEVTSKLLSELGCDGIPRVNVLNKADKLPEGTNITCDDSTVLISAKQGRGLDELLECIAKNLPETAIRGRFVIPYDKASLYFPKFSSPVIFVTSSTNFGILSCNELFSNTSFTDLL